MTTRKRRRQEAFEEPPEPEPEPVQTEEEAAKAREEKEQEIWDSVREAHYEAIEQLPLTLQRQLSLMRQLDEQASSCLAQILPTLQNYIELRRQIAGKSCTGDSLEPGEKTTEAIAPAGPSSSTKSASSVGKEKVESSRAMAQQIALLSEEILRASQEKVNIAQANSDSVERHIKLLDQAIKEQEAALSSDPNNPVHTHLPELVIPQWRPEPAQSTLDANMDQKSEDRNPVDVVGDNPTERGTSKRKGKDGKDGKKGKQPDDPTSLTITLPAAQPGDEPELLYCYCNRVSFGEMIACDNPNCEHEWFHYGCVGLSEPPEGEWFCEDCRLQQEDA